MIGAVVVIVSIFGTFMGVPLVIWAALGCPHSDDLTGKQTGGPKAARRGTTPSSS